MCKTAVLVIFFNRPDCLAETFEQVRKAKPEKLYLAQDGPRENNEKDMEGILACRKIVENIDWDCEVYRNYSIVNRGCGLGPYNAIDWAFTQEEQLIVLEDDCVASQSFFRFCDDMLELYKEDNRIFLITGCNFELKTQDCQSSYFFGHSGTNWGWATWKRNWEKMDYKCSWVQNDVLRKKVETSLQGVCKRKAKREMQLFIDTYKRVSSGENISYWDVQWQATRYLNNQLSIIPACNQITNIGLGPTSTHAQKSIIPKQLYSEVGKMHFCYNERYEMDYPLIHPEHMVRNNTYDDRVDKELYQSFIKRCLGKLKRIIRR